MSNSTEDTVEEKKIISRNDYANSTNNVVGLSRSSGANEPAHYILKIESFSLLSVAGIEKYESDVFEVGGYKWRLLLYPNGNEKENAENHISLYLAIVDATSFPHGWEVNVYFKFFVYDHIRDNYLTIRDANGKKRRFHELKTEWGFAKLLSLDRFEDVSSGFLFQDSCVFGAEVFVTPKYAQKEQCLSMIRPPMTNNTYTWKIDKFSAIEVLLNSEDFKVGKLKWKILLYPRGNNDGKGTHLSIYLALFDCASLPLGWRYYANFKLRVKNQAGSNDFEEVSSCWFCDSIKDWGFKTFMLLSDLNESAKGFIVNDTLIVEAEISAVGMIKNSI